ncbi:putative MFS-type transporter YttB [Robertmurraya siralis]|uniref:MFS-type transporter YttB n=1 Tax=Robertmurraya siralis TaxID=77777 RepID=A0A919WDR0_9BACI|nr:MFS transporter [Robertmurraya siralis]PAE19400.1 MFS transporter [Bacillus sp. 7504-2]GIN60056.1 putative MFS-type transporter YttB [Robertmurraya siralis]
MPRSLWLLVIGMAVNVTGSSFLWPLNAIYIHEHLGKTLSISGIVLMLNAGATVIGNLFGGFLFDKIGGYKSILLGITITVVSFTGLSFWHSFLPYVTFLTIAGFGSGIIFPSMYAMAGAVWKEGGRRAFNAIYVAQNLGVAIGASLGGIVASYSFQFIFIANTLMYVIFLAIALMGYRTIQTTTNLQSVARLEPKPDKDYTKLYALLILCIGYLLCWVGYVQWQATISTYTQQLNISLKQYSFLWTINGALIVLGQPFLNRALRIKAIEKNVKTQIVIGMLIFIISFLIAAKAEAFSGFLTAMIILTVGEMLVWPAVPTIADKLAPKGREGFYQGIVNSTATGGRMIGPILGGLLVDLYGMSMLFTVLIFLFVIAIFTTIFYDRKLAMKAEQKVVSEVSH